MRNRAVPRGASPAKVSARRRERDEDVLRCTGCVAAVGGDLHHRSGRKGQARAVGAFRSPDVVRCFVHSVSRSTRSAFEAGTLTQHLTYGLPRGRLRGGLHGGAPGECGALRDAQQDRQARCTRDRPDPPFGLVQPGAVKSIESHYTRALLTSRKVIQRKCIDLENEVRGLLKVFGVKLPMRLSRGTFDAPCEDTIERRSRPEPCAPADAAGAADALRHLSSSIGG